MAKNFASLHTGPLAEFAMVTVALDSAGDVIAAIAAPERLLLITDAPTLGEALRRLGDVVDTYEIENRRIVLEPYDG